MAGIIVSNPPIVELPPGSTSGGTVGLPPVAYQYAIPTLPQTWTGVQTYDPNTLAFSGSGAPSNVLVQETPNGPVTVRQLQASDIVGGGGGGGTPGGSNGQIQINNSGSFGGITTGTGVTTALGVNTGSAGSFVVNGGAAGTPSSIGLSNATGLPLTTGVAGILPNVNLNLAVAPAGRITLASGVAVMATSQAGATTVYYTPCAGNIVPIYDGTNMVPTAFAELSQATIDATKSPAAVAASKIYDLFVWNDGGTIRCTRGPAWTNSTTRGYTFTMVNGILLNTSAITNGPGAQRGTWVGTIASNASSTIDWILGAGASGGSAAVLNVWNAYNRVLISTTVTDSSASYTYTTATIRQANNSAGNQVSYLVGSAEESASIIYSTYGQAVAVNGLYRAGICLDGTTTFTNYNFMFGYGAISLSSLTNWIFNPSIGTRFVAAVEQGDGTNANRFNNTSNNALIFQFRM